MRRFKERGASRPHCFIHFGAGTPILLEAPGGADALPVIFSLFLIKFSPFSAWKGNV